MEKNIYTEVYDILNFLGEEYKKELPVDLLESLEKNIDPIYLKELSKKEQEEKDTQYSEDALAMIAFFNIKYWCKNEKENKELRKLYKSNDNS